MLSHGEANTAGVSSVTIDSLPNELLAAVFVTGREHSSKLHAHEMEVSHVARRWRNVAVHTGALWTNIFITCRQSPQLISLYLKRSGSHPLYVTLIPDGQRHYESFDMSPFRNIIIPHINRIRQFVLYSTREFNSTLFKDPLFRSHLPQLKTLLIDWDQGTFFDNDNVESGIFTGGTPLLTSVELRGDGGIRVRPSLAAVTTLTLGSVNTSRKWNTIHFHDFLAATPQLSSLCIDGEIIGSWPDPEPIAIPSLISLDINFELSNRIFVRCIITTLMTPNLESLTLRDVDERVIMALSSVLESQHRYPLLQSLHFYGISIHESANWFATVLATLPVVTHLSLIGGEAYNAADILARNTSSADVLLPELSSLRFEPMDEKVDSIYNLISHRLTHGLPISQLQSSSSIDTIPQERQAWLRERLELVEFPLPNRSLVLPSYMLF